MVLLFFGYTQCLDVYPTTLATWRKIHEALIEDADQVRFAFVMVELADAGGKLIAGAEVELERNMNHAGI